MSKISKATAFAVAAHSAVGQKRKYTGDEYWRHPIAVSHLIKNFFPNDKNMIAAALLHDVVEDTQVTIETIQMMFGEDIANLVYDLTDVSKPEHGNRAARKAIDRQHTAAASPRAKAIKLADLIHNTQSIVEHDQNFAIVYLEEKELLLEVLRDSASPELWNLALKMLINSILTIEQNRLNKALDK